MNSNCFLQYFVLSTSFAFIYQWQRCVAHAQCHQSHLHESQNCNETSQFFFKYVCMSCCQHVCLHKFINGNAVQQIHNVDNYICMTYKIVMENNCFCFQQLCTSLCLQDCLHQFVHCNELLQMHIVGNHICMLVLCIFECFFCTFRKRQVFLLRPYSNVTFFCQNGGKPDLDIFV